MTAPPPPAITVGIDLGSETTKAVLGPSLDYELIRNDQGGHTTPTSVTFRGPTRLIGEAASEARRADAGTVLHVSRLLPGMGMEDDGDAFREFCRFRTDGTSSTVDYGGDPDRTFSAPALLAMLLGKVRRDADAAVRRLSGGDDGDGGSGKSGPPRKYVVALPPGSSAAARSAVADAAFAAGLGEDARVVDAALCAAAAYGRKNQDRDSGSESDRRGRVVAVVDVGHSGTDVSILRLGGSVDAEMTEPDERGTEGKSDDGEIAAAPAVATLLGSASRRCLGAGLVDIRLFHHFRSTVPGLADIKPASQRGQRLLDGCRKLKHLLSMLTVSSVTVETLGTNDADVTLTVTREALGDLCRAEAEELSAVVKEAMNRADGVEDSSDVTSVEILGGGCRIPLMRDAILTALGRDPSADGGADGFLSRGMDDTCVALGAAALGDDAVGPRLASLSVHEMEDVQEEAVGADADAEGRRRSELRAAEEAMANLDGEMARLSEARNKIEAHVLEMRGAKHGKFAAHLPDGAVIDPYFNDLDDWLFSDECEAFGLAEMEAKLAAVLEKTNDLCGNYFEAVRKDAEKKEKEMEDEAKRGQAEREAEGEDADGDHDFRKLPTKRRLEIVAKNKNEATELFKDGNIRHAAARYAKALSHCSKFFDLSPEEKKEVDAIKLSLHLNMSLAYIKLEKPDNALRSCNDALDLEPENVKALYRRAKIYFDKKKWDDCGRDLKKAVALAPMDKSIKKLEAHLQQQLKRQKAKEKKLAQKMFG